MANNYKNTINLLNVSLNNYTNAKNDISSTSLQLSQSKTKYQNLIENQAKTKEIYEQETQLNCNNKIGTPIMNDKTTCTQVTGPYSRCDALVQCYNIAGCTGIKVTNCDETGNNYYLCGTSPNTNMGPTDDTTSSYSNHLTDCIYRKPPPPGDWRSKLPTEITDAEISNAKADVVNLNSILKQKNQNVANIVSNIADYDNKLKTCLNVTGTLKPNQICCSGLLLKLNNQCVNPYLGPLVNDAPVPPSSRQFGDEAINDVSQLGNDVRQFGDEAINEPGQFGNEVSQLGNQAENVVSRLGNQAENEVRTRVSKLGNQVENEVRTRVSKLGTEANSEARKLLGNKAVTEVSQEGHKAVTEVSQLSHKAVTEAKTEVGRIGHLFHHF